MYKIATAAVVLLLSSGCGRVYNVSNANEPLSGEMLFTNRGAIGVMQRRSNQPGTVAFEVIVQQGRSERDDSLVASGILAEVECSSGVMRAVSQKTYRGDSSVAHESILPGNPTRDDVYDEVISRLCSGKNLDVDFQSLDQFLALANGAKG